MTINPSWITQPGILFTATESIFTSTTIVASGTNITYNVISGNVPPGLQVSTTGTIFGVPNPVTNKSRSTFVVRAQTTQSAADRTFSIDVEGVTPITWATSNVTLLGSDSYLNIGPNREPYGINQQYVNFQISATTNYESSPGLSLTYYLPDNSILPNGLSLSQDGVISGFIRDLLDINNAGISIPKKYRFAVAVTDSVTTTATYYTILVTAPDFIRTPNQSDLPPNFITFSENPDYIPPLQFIKNSDLGRIKSQNNVLIDVSAYDPYPTEGYISYEITGTDLTISSLLDIDTSTGVIYGAIPYRPAYLETHRFNIIGKKYIKDTNFTATTQTYTLTIQGYTDYSIAWTTERDLGQLFLGEVSVLNVIATQTGSNKFNIVYRLVNGSLPSGLTLNADGSISGRVNYSENPGTFVFKVNATDIYNISSIEKEFSILVKRDTNKEYTRIYCSPLLAADERKRYSDFILNSEIFDPNMIYRYSDPEFGVQTTPKLTLEFGIEQVPLNVLVSGLENNFVKRRFTLGNIKVATAIDSTGHAIYEVIYSEIIDNLTKDGTSVALSLDVGDVTVFPASLDNMRYRLSHIELPDHSNIGINEMLLPQYMKSSINQGYISVVPICFVKPGFSNKIIRKIKSANIKLNTFDFQIDRITIDTPSGPKYLLLKR